MAIDTAGYSRLMSLDEHGTHIRVRRKMRELLEPSVSEYGGRIVKGTGDGMLVEFTGGIAAVQCGAEIQRRNEAAEQARDVDQRIRFRIGISLGDIFIEDDDIYGDGVNIAVRLEGIANVGGIYASEAAAKSAETSGFVFVDLGLKYLKNITRPIRVYRIEISGEVSEAQQVSGASLALTAWIRTTSTSPTALQRM
jgi:adenylate cyclase